MSETNRMTIVEFLEARVAEDESQAKKAAASISPAMDASREPIGPEWENDRGMVFGQPNKDGYPIPLWDNEGSSTLSMDSDASAHVARHDPARVLAECAAKRAIIEQAQEASSVEQEFDDYVWRGAGPKQVDPYTGDAILSALAAVYKDHPDYQQEWSV